MAVALVHGGVLPSFFSERLYQNLCSTPTSPPTLEEVADQDLQLKLKKVCQFCPYLLYFFIYFFFIIEVSQRPASTNELSMLS